MSGSKRKTLRVGDVLARAVPNPYLDEAQAVNFGRPDYDAYATLTRRNASEEAMRALFNEGWGRRAKRDELVTRYAWAIPNAAALSALAQYSPLVEVGAGTGYWAWLLRKMGVDILPYDLRPPRTAAHANDFHRWAPSDSKGRIIPSQQVVGTCWTPVSTASARRAASLHPDRTLMLCWPPYDKPMAHQALQAYRGECVAYIGESQGGATADDAFHDLLEAEWDEVQSVSIPQWEGIHDALLVYRRKQCSDHDDD